MRLARTVTPNEAAIYMIRSFMLRPISPSSMIFPVRIEGIRDATDDSAIHKSTIISCFQYGFRYENTLFIRADVTLGTEAISSSLI